ncbi:hypothetical protein M569_16408, partial [Genlisea aurea]
TSAAMENAFAEETSWYNDAVLGTFLPEAWWKPLPHFLRGVARNYVAGLILYLVSGTFFSFVVYRWNRAVSFPK